MTEEEDKVKKREYDRKYYSKNRDKLIKPRPNTPCLLYTSPSPRDRTRSRMPSSA